jgi:predicted O-methyltransferase YrrM
MKELSNLAKLRKKAGNIGGWITVQDQEWMADFLTGLEYPKEYTPIVAEIGVFQGGGTLLYLTALENCHVYCIDNWSDEAAASKPLSLKENFWKFIGEFKDRVTLIEDDSKNVGKDWNVETDIVMIDGCHDKGYPTVDVDNFSRTLKVGGYLLIDDSGMKDVIVAINKVKASGNYELIKDGTGLNLTAFKKKK